MNTQTPENQLEALVQRDQRYTIGAYLFLREALDYTVRSLEKPRHVGGQELLDGIRKYALSEFGPITRRVLSEWGIYACIDFGNLVFNLVDEGLLGKTDEDSIDDFTPGYDFEEAFSKPFLAKKTKTKKQPKSVDTL